MNFVINSKDNNVFVSVPVELENTYTNIKSLKISLKPSGSFLLETYILSDNIEKEQSIEITGGSFFDESDWLRKAIDTTDFILVRPHNRSRFASLYYVAPTVANPEGPKLKKEIRVNQKSQTLVHESERTHVSTFFN
jgi:hypothetical protein